MSEWACDGEKNLDNFSVSTGVSDSQELLVFASHRVGPAVQPHLPAEEGLGQRAQVSNESPSSWD